MIKSLHVENFALFENANFEDFAGVNLFIGVNDTGKSTILKTLYFIESELNRYCLMRFNYINYLKGRLEIPVVMIPLSDEGLPLDDDRGAKVRYKYSKGILKKRLKDLGVMISNEEFVLNEGLAESEFCMEACKEKLEDLGVMISNKEFVLNGKVLNSNDVPIFYDTSHSLAYKPNEDLLKFYRSPLFIPSKEIVSFKDLIKMGDSERLDYSLDKTYIDLVNAIEIKKTTNEKARLKTFDKYKDYNFYEGEVKLIHDGAMPRVVYQKNANSQFEMGQTAEGIRRLGIFELLNDAGSLTKNTVLFIDEPENSLHPQAVRSLMRFLVDISKEGVQVFMASHSSFVLSQLSNIAEIDKYPINVYSFSKNKNGGIDIDGAYNLVDTFPENAISGEAMAMFEERP